MKILYLTQHFPPESQAAAFRAAETAELLSAGGIEVHVITGFPNHAEARKQAKYKHKLILNEQYGQVHVTRVYTPLDTKHSSLIRLLNYFCYMALAFFAGLFLPKPAVVYASSPPLFVSLPGLALAKLKRAKYVLEVRDLWVDFAILLGQLRGRFFIYIASKIEQVVTRAAAKIVVVTAGYKQHYIEQGIDADKIEIIYGGIDFSNPVFSLSEFDGSLKEKHQLGGKFIVGYAGNIGYAQGLDVLLEAADLMRNEEVAFLLIGDGADKERLCVVKEEKGLDNVIFAGQVSREEVAKYIHSFDCYLVTLLNHSLFQITLPTKLFEAMAFRKPVLLGLNGEAQGIVERAEAGLTFDIDRPETMVEAINYLKNHPKERKVMAENGYQFAKDNFNREHLVGRLSNILKECGKSNLSGE